MSVINNHIYTAQEMRAIADSDDFSAYGYDDPKYHADPDCAEIDVTQMVREMLRQAADVLEREKNRNKKYEYGYRSKVGKSVIVREFDTKAEAVQELIGNWGDGEIVRRSVGEWEDVK